MKEILKGFLHRRPIRKTEKLYAGNHVIQSRGGLPPEVWDTIISSPPIRYSPDLIAYGEAVKAELIDDSEYNHRNFLGRDHWKELANHFADRNNVPLYLYAKMESEIAYSAQERGDVVEKKSSEADPVMVDRLSWSKELKRWMLRRSLVQKKALSVNSTNSLSVPIGEQEILVREANLEDVMRLRGGFFVPDYVGYDDLKKQSQKDLRDGFLTRADKISDENIQNLTNPWHYFYIKDTLSYASPKWLLSIAAKHIQEAYALHFAGVTPYIDYVEIIAGSHADHVFVIQPYKNAVEYSTKEKGQKVTVLASFDGNTQNREDLPLLHTKFILDEIPKAGK